ncbi:MAG: cytochrome b/b6 domain-containing protein [Desulfotomaculaceae bacterium]|nr:cytochrome b/b6 domain-containing protein [Desulfotomaculaceae bacterium]
MAVLFIVLIYAHDTGITLHEIAGLTIFAFFTFHVALNWSWVKSVTKNLFTAKFKKKSKLMYILNSALLICVSVIIITGIVISRVVFDLGLNGYNHHTITAVHRWLAYACLGLFAVHVALNWRFVSVNVRKIFHNYRGGKLWKSMQPLGAAVLIILVVYLTAMPASGKKSQQSTTVKDTLRENPAMINNECKTKEDKDYTISNTKSDTTATFSLTDYLSNIFCTACDKHCPLSNPQCKTGQSQMQATKIQYEELYR